MKCIGKLCEYYNRNEMKSSFICGLDGWTHCDNIKIVDCQVVKLRNDALTEYNKLKELSTIICELQEG